MCLLPRSNNKMKEGRKRVHDLSVEETVFPESILDKSIVRVALSNNMGFAVCRCDRDPTAVDLVIVSSGTTKVINTNNTKLEGAISNFVKDSSVQLSKNFASLDYMSKYNALSDLSYKVKLFVKG